MIVLGIETSCDETAAAILSDGNVLSSVVSTHWLHATFGGVVPELASRAHLMLLPPILDQAIAEARITIEQVDAIAVTQGPGLIGALLVGIATAKAIAFSRNLPLVGVNHLEGHLWSSQFDAPDLKPPFLALLVSGGHTMLIAVLDFDRYQILGQTRDDAAGEAFDKVAVLCGLGYPGGAQVEKIAIGGNPSFFEFPVGMRGQKGFDFSFSGLKTAVSTYIKKTPEVIQNHSADVLASFQKAAVESLVQPTCRALDQKGYKALVISGGVAANLYLRKRLEEECKRRKVQFLHPGLQLCTDNAMMIAWVGWRRLLNGERDDFKMSGDADMPLPGLIE